MAGGRAAMNRTGLADKLAARMNITKGQSYEVVGHVFDLMREHMVARKEGVAIHGFGVFKVKTLAARTSRNPKTGEAIEVPEKMTVKLALAKEFKEALN